jgi:hypothetical protein
LNWEAVGALGEIVGAFAVVLTLVYLSMQTRQNTFAVRHATTRGVTEDANSWRYKIIESPEVAELFRTGLQTPDSLDSNDKYRFRLLLDALFAHWQHAFESGEPIANVNIPRILSRPGGAWYWSRARSTADLFSAEFVEFIESQTEA